jgi:hypothetical protein
MSGLAAKIHTNTSFDGPIRPIIKAACSFSSQQATGQRMRRQQAVNPGQTVDMARASHEPADWWCPRLGETGGRLGLLGIETGRATGSNREQTGSPGEPRGIHHEPPPLGGGPSNHPPPAFQPPPHVIPFAEHRSDEL